MNKIHNVRSLQTNEVSAGTPYTKRTARNIEPKRTFSIFIFCQRKFGRVAKANKIKIENGMQLGLFSIDSWKF